MLTLCGFPDDFAEIIGNKMNTDFTAKQMIGHIRDAKPRTMEEVVDEMLGILEFRGTYIKQKIV